MGSAGQLTGLIPITKPQIEQQTERKPRTNRPHTVLKPFIRRNHETKLDFTP
jgi:hypothetical protein